MYGCIQLLILIFSNPDFVGAGYGHSDSQEEEEAKLLDVSS
jgi:hypothetical protein